MWCVSVEEEYQYVFYKQQFTQKWAFGYREKTKEENDYGSLSNRPQVFDILPDSR